MHKKLCATHLIFKYPNYPFLFTFLTPSFMGGGVMSAVAKFTATGIRGVMPPVQSSVQSTSEVSPADGGEDSTARVVSGSVLCFDEATTELKHALHKYTLFLYLIIVHFL